MTSRRPVNLAERYAQRMEHHGLGMGLFLPVSTKDLSPPCCGFFDRNGDWNLITRLEHSASGHQTDGYLSLNQPLKDISQISIKWQPKTSAGVQEQAIDTSVQSPMNVPGGADAHLKFTSSSEFGAVLMTDGFVTLKAYHQEKVFAEWLEANKQLLYENYGSQLRKYGLWIITKTYAAHSASIKAWYKEDKDVLVSLAAKASMLGELKSELSSKDKVLDKDWSHYYGTAQDEQVVVFVDGIETGVSYWWWKSIELNIPFITKSRSPNPSTSRIAEEPPTNETQSKHEQDTDHLATPERRPMRHASLSAKRPSTLVNDGEVDKVLLKDAFAGMHSVSRSSSVRVNSRPASMVSSMHGSAAQSRSTSLKRDNRNIARVAYI